MRKYTTFSIPFLALGVGLMLAGGAAWGQEQAPAPTDQAMATASFEEDWAEPQFRADSVGLSDEQKAKWKELRQSFRKDQIQARADLRVQQMELIELMQAENPDRAAIARKLEAISAARTAQALARFDHGQQMLSILTPEQRNQVKKMRQERRSSRRFNRRGRRGGRGFGRGFGPRGREPRHWGPRGDWDCPCGMGPGVGQGPPPRD